MGILNGNKLCNILMEKSNRIDGGNESQSNDMNLYVDGEILIRSGLAKNTHRAQSDDHLMDILIYNFKSKLKSICELSTKFGKLCEIYIIFDGKSPKLKSKCQARRKAAAAIQHTVRYINFEVARNSLNQYFVNYKSTLPHGAIIRKECRVVNAVGEAEDHIYKNRDRTRMSVLYTKDTDLYAIAYGHVPETLNDQVFFINGTNSNVYDMSNFTCDLDRSVFRLILTLSGTDFNSGIFTESMLSTLAVCLFVSEKRLKNIFSKLDDVNLNDYIDKVYIIRDMLSKLVCNTCDDVQLAICVLLQLLEILKTIKFPTLLPETEKLKLKYTISRITFPRSTNVQMSDEMFEKNIKLILWVIQYFDRGSDFEEFHNDTLVNVVYNNTCLYEYVRKKFIHQHSM
jgi:hypothetical protein